MKAVVYDTYGPPEVLRIEEVEKPVPKDDEVLLEVRAASVNPLDWHFMRGTPYLVRIMTGLGKPQGRLGVDVAGRVEAIGKNVTSLKPGDEVFGSCTGAFAEYACGTEKSLVAKPDSMTFEQAAAVNVGGITALQGLRDKARVRAGQKVLINGAAGGVGTFAVQIAKSLGAEVTGVCSTRNVELVRSIGADRAIDYTLEDYTECWQCYDVIFDCIGNHSLSANRRVLTRKGVYLIVGGKGGNWIDPLLAMVQPRLLSMFVSQRLTMMLAMSKREDLVALRDLIESGKVTPVIDRQYPLSETAEAMRYVEEGHARGKVILVPDARSAA